MSSETVRETPSDNTMQRGTDKSRRPRQIRQELRRLRAALDTLPDALFIVRRIGLELVAVNQAACRSLGYTRPQLRAMRLAQLLPEACRSQIVAELNTRVGAGADMVVLPAVQCSRDGFEVAVEWSVRAMPRCGGRLLMVVARPLECGRAGGARTSPDVQVDPLTGLPDRLAFDARLADLLEQAQRQAGWRFAVLFVDLDRFKPVNDAFGHLHGDHLLREVARRLAACVRPGDMVARRGGDEFTVLVDRLQDHQAAIGVAERIQSQLNAPLEFHGQRLTITASIGIAMSASHYRTPDEMIHDADRAMYRAKGAGGAACVVFEESTGNSPWQS
jgi:diguanylate cyclase (GGDEF)-like protein/PAS domain S-box-containing protein